MSTSRLTRRSERYYISGGDVYFLVDEIYFRVHRHFFARESEKFSKLFDKSVANTKAGRPDGTSEASAFPMDGVSAEIFEKLLWVFYNPRFSIYAAALEDWGDILKVATQWNFPEVKALAVRELEKCRMDLVERIVLYKKYNVDAPILALLYARLCGRDAILTKEESEALGLETAIKVFQAREKLRARDVNTSGMKSPLPEDVGQDKVLKIVEQLFVGKA